MDLRQLETFVAVAEERSFSRAADRLHVVQSAVSVEVRQGGSARQAEAVRAGDLDLAFIGLPDQRLPGLHVARLADVQMFLACHPGHRLAGRAGIELEALTDEPFADLPPEWG